MSASKLKVFSDKLRYSELDTPEQLQMKERSLSRRRADCLLGISQKTLTCP